jgi:NarL family two-component system response regulator LiaR
MVSIAIIDDHSLVLEAMSAWIRDSGRYTIAGTAGSVDAAAELFAGLSALPDIVILDISLGGEDGLSVIPALRELCEKRKAPLPGILVCSMYDDPFIIQDAKAAGARAFISKSDDIAELDRAITALMAGKTFFGGGGHEDRPRLENVNLTSREREIIRYLKQSLSNRQIADRMSISIRTVENHLSHIYVKTGIMSRAELAGKT